MLQGWILALCEAGYFRLLESSGPEEEEYTLEASIRGALDTSLALVGQAHSLETGLDLCCISFSNYGDQEEGAFKGLSEFEAETLRKALQVLRCPDQASNELAVKIDAVWLGQGNRLPVRGGQ